MDFIKEIPDFIYRIIVLGILLYKRLKGLILFYYSLPFNILQ
jgi:hypothetical protein